MVAKLITITAIMHESRTNKDECRAMIYRKDLDGLRGLAVLLVIFFHAEVVTFSGGYIGVDIFYVLSGFLITSIINDQSRGNEFTFYNFYIGRIRRLLPVFLFFLLVVSLIASYILAPEAYIDYIKSVKYSLIFQANVFFDRLADNYFAAETNTLFLAHTWSLSIEWQFYLLWPFIFYLLRKLFRGYVLIFIVVAFFIVFAGYSQYLSLYEPKHSYYLFTARVFEMLGGSALALALASDKLPKPHIVLSHLLSSSGLVALIALSVMYTSDIPYPGVNALFVCLATLAIIYSGGAGFGNWLLSFKPLVFTGVLSYSLYLWHWPILVVLRDFNINFDASIIAGAIGLSLGISVLSWHFIEKPFRYKHKYSHKKTVLVFFFIPAVVVALFAEVTKKNEGFPQRFGPEALRVHAALDSVVTPNIDKCNPPESADLSLCMFGAGKPDSLDAVLLGDSHARHFREFADVLATDAGLSVYGVTAPACLVVPKLKIHLAENYCPGGIVDSIYDVIELNKPRYAIIAQNWMGYAESKRMVYRDDDEQSVKLTEKRIEESVIAAIGKIVAAGTIPVIIKSAPGDAINQFECVYQHIKERRVMRDDECVIDTADEDSNNAKYFIDQVFAKIAVLYPQSIFIDPRLVLCSEGKCMTAIDGVPIYEDVEHINSYASRWIAQQYLAKYGNPLVTRGVGDSGRGQR